MELNYLLKSQIISLYYQSAEHKYLPAQKIVQKGAETHAVRLYNASRVLW